METAAFFMSGRLRYGDSRMYVADILPQADKLLRENRPIDSSQMRRFESSVEAIDESGVKQVIRGLFEEYQKRSDQNYIQYFYMATELGNRLAEDVYKRQDPPKFLRSKWFRYGFLLFFFTMFFQMIWSTWLVFGEAHSLSPVSYTHLDVYKRQHHSPSILPVQKNVL